MRILSQIRKSAGLIEANNNPAKCFPIKLESGRPIKMAHPHYSAPNTPLVNNAQRIDEALRTLAAAEGSHEKIAFADQVNHGNKGTRIHPEPRIIALMRGRQEVEISVAGCRQRRLLTPGDTLFLAPNAWFRPDYSHDHVIFGVVFQPGKLRLLINDHEAKIGHRPPRCWVSVSILGSGALSHVVEALKQMVACRSDRIAAAALLRSVFLIARTALGRSPPGTHLKGLHLYTAIQEYLQSHCRDQLDRNLVAEVFDIHPGHLSRLYKEHGAESFNASLNRLRLERSQAWLRNTQLPVETISAECGYGSSGHFIRRFRHAFGCTPGHYRTTTPSGKDGKGIVQPKMAQMGTDEGKHK